MLGPRPRYMELSSRKTSKRAIEPVDEWLQNEGFYRKHAPKDPTCLFRAVSEQVYHSQRNHIIVRTECIEFMKKNKHMFEEKISTPYDSYLAQMACFTEWGGMNELLAISLLYQKNVVIFHGQKLTKETVIDHGFEHSINLCFTPPKQYESVYTQEHTSDAGFCQSIVYQTLYKNVFNMANVDTTVYKMLHERTNNLRHDKFFLKGNVEIRNQLAVELQHKLEENEDDSEESQLLAKGITPFPYRVAKALDPNIYRNVDYDIWHEIRKEVRNSGYTKFYSNELQAGSKCLVQVDLRENDRVNNNFLTGKENWDTNKAPMKGKHMEPLFYTGHIQEMSKNQGPVVVFIEELGEKMTVPYQCLKSYPMQRKMRQNPFPVVPNKKNMIPQNTKWKKPYNNQIRRMTPTDNGADRNQTNTSKPVAKNPMTKSDWSADANSENQLHSSQVQVKPQPEAYPPYKDYNAAVDTVKVVLENTHLTSVETAERAISEQVKNKPPVVNAVAHNNQPKKQPPANYNQDMNYQNNKQPIQRAEKNEIFYPPYQNGGYPIHPRFPNETEYGSYDVKNVESQNGEVPVSDPATVRHFYNLGVKYYWTHNAYPPNSGTGPAFSENTFYVTQPPLDVTVGTNIMNGPMPPNMPPNEHMNQPANPNHQPNIPNNHNNNNISNNPRNNFRSSTPRSEGINGPRPNGQKSNYRHPNQQTQYQHQNMDFNRNRVDYKNSNTNDQQQQHQQQQHQQQQHQQLHMQNKDMQRGNKNNMAPRFKKNYDGRNRGEHQYQYNPDYRYNKNRQPQPQPIQQPQQQQQQQLPPPIESTLEMNEAMQIQQQQQPHSQPPPPPPPPTSVMQQQQQQTQTPPPQPPPPINGNYPYPLYNQQVSYVPIGPYPIDAEAFPGHFYPVPPTNFVPLSYLPPPEMTDGPPGGPPLYSPMDAFPAQYPAIYSPPFVPYHMPPAMYPSPPPSSAPAGIPEGCYPGPPFPGQPYFFPYPPPPMPANMIPSPQNSPAH